MSSDLKIFDYFVDDLLLSDDNLLNHELDILLMQYIFNSIDLETFKAIDTQKTFSIAS